MMAGAVCPCQAVLPPSSTIALPAQQAWPDDPPVWRSCTMDPTSAIVMPSCVYWGALFGGAITSILFKSPARPGWWRPPSTATRWCSKAGRPKP